MLLLYQALVLFLHHVEQSLAALNDFEEGLLCFLNSFVELLAGLILLGELEVELIKALTQLLDFSFQVGLLLLVLSDLFMDVVPSAPNVLHVPGEVAVVLLQSGGL